MKIVLAADHGGFEFKEKIKPWLISLGHTVVDVGAFKHDKLDGYDKFTLAAVKKMREDKNSFGIVFCRTGAGPVMLANRFKRINAVACDSAELARLTRAKNNANMLCLGADYLSFDTCKEIIEIFLNTQFLEGIYRARIDTHDKFGED